MQFNGYLAGGLGLAAALEAKDAHFQKSGRDFGWL